MYNEAATVAEVLAEVLARPETAEIIVVDDASTDNSRAIVERFIIEHGNSRIRLLCQQRNQGKGAAVRRGLEAAVAPIVIIQDADREYPPANFAAVIAPIIAGQADVVYGSRFLGHQGRSHYLRHRLANGLLTFLSNLCSGLSLTDMETCHKAFRRPVVQNLALTSDRFGIEVELTAKLAKCRRLRVREVPIAYHGRSFAEGKKITWRDGLAALWFIVKYNLFTLPSASRRKPWQQVLG